MFRGKHARESKRAGKFQLILATTAVALVLCCIIGGTVAWLVAETEPVMNTFTYGDINIDLSETDTNKDGDGNPNTNKYPMVPGNPITKDPVVKVLANSEDAWLFVKLEKSDNFDDFMTYDVADGWTALDGAEGVYYRESVKADADAEYGIIKDNTVDVKDEVTKEMLNALDKNADGTDKAEADKAYPTLTVTAYAVQRDSNIATAADAWAKIAQ